MGSDLKEREKLRRECKVLNLRLAKGRECVNWAKNKIPDDHFFGPRGQEKARKTYVKLKLEPQRKSNG